jgi:tetratricopeptide (TPR) repeat protein
MSITLTDDFEKAKELRFSGKNLEAKELLEQLKKTGDGYFELAMVELALGNAENALTALNKAISCGAPKDYYFYELIKIYRHKKDYAKATKIAEQFLTNHPDNYNALYELGILHKLAGNAEKSRAVLKKAYSINPNDNLKQYNEKVKSVTPSRRDVPPYRVFYTWTMHYVCNYQCLYCYIPAPDNPSIYHRHYIANYKNDIVQAWKNIYDMYGSGTIRLDGGEPTVYPEFLKLLKELSQYHYIQINTNLSFDIDKFLKASINPERVRFDASLHPEHTNLDDFAAKLEKLKSRGFKLVVSYVAHPVFIDNIAPAKLLIEKKMGIPFLIHPFSGEYNGKIYPRDYAPEEKDKIYSIDLESRIQLNWRSAKNVSRGIFIFKDMASQIAMFAKNMTFKGDSKRITQEQKRIRESRRNAQKQAFSELASKYKSFKSSLHGIPRQAYKITFSFNDILTLLKRIPYFCKYLFLLLKNIIFELTILIKTLILFIISSSIRYYNFFIETCIYKMYLVLDIFIGFIILLYSFKNKYINVRFPGFFALPTNKEPQPEPENGKPCRMGQMYAKVYPDGSVFRCCTDNGWDYLGNMFKEKITLLENPKKCLGKRCRCWRCMTVGEEKRWLDTWVDDWERPAL